MVQYPRMLPAMGIVILMGVAASSVVRPILIAGRGPSGYRLEHTLTAHS
jgi:hypothetical protein